MVYVIRKDKESTAAMLRRFQRKTQLAGLLLESRRKRFKRQTPSTYKKRRSALRRIKITSLYKRLQKEGLIEEGKPIPQQLKKKFAG